MSDDDRRSLLQAISFAARAHQGQMRKDRQTPYASHPFRVCLIVRHVFGINDDAVLTAAVLHDTIEDTTTDFDDISERFGEEIAAWVAALSKDMRRPEQPREEAYHTVLAAAPWQVKVCKLADIYDNLLDGGQLKSEARQRTFRRSRAYLDALDTPDLPPEVRQAHEAVSRLLEELQGRIV